MRMLEVSESVEMQFEDGRYVVPKWWSRLPSFRGIGMVDGIRMIPFNYTDARGIVNKDLDQTAITNAIRSWRTRKPKEQNPW
jgi:hypothetical protein